MLRTFTNAALEHSRSLDVDSESETEFTDDEHPRSLSCGQKCGIFIGYILPTWGHLSLANVGRSWAAGALALWHCFLILAAACLIFCNCASVVLRSYIIWYTKLDQETATSPEGRFHLTILFYGAFFRCYIMQSATTDVLRFAFILCRDAWRPDVFEAYRRLLVGDAWGELEAGELYICSWSRLTKHQTWLDIFFQMLLHLSMDLVPLVFLIMAQRIGSHSAWILWAEVCLLTGCIHIFVFYSLWWIGEVSLKVKYFCRAWQQARAFNGFRHGRSSIMHMTHSIWVMHDENQFDSHEQEHRSVCVTLCTLFHWGEYLFPVIICACTFVFGLVDQRSFLALLGGSAMVMSWIVMTASNYADRIQPLQPPGWLNNAFNSPDVLQRWGEKWCRLNHSAQKRQRHPFAITLIMLGAVFGGYRLKWLSLSCLAILFFLFLRLLFMYFEGNFGWAAAICEAFFESILLQCLVIQTADRPLLDASLIFLLCAMRQFGFQREVRAGDRIRVVSLMALGVVHVCWAFVTSFQKNNWSAFCADMSNCRYEQIIPRPVINQAYTPLCQMEFPRPDGRDLKFGDFGLFASLTYEPRERIQKALHHYFPEWHLDVALHETELRDRPGPQVAAESVGSKNLQGYRTCGCVRNRQHTVAVIKDASVGRATAANMKVSNRLTVAKNFDQLCQAFGLEPSVSGPELTAQKLMQPFIQLMKDNEQEVRKEAVRVIEACLNLRGPEVTKSVPEPLTSEQLQQHILPEAETFPLPQLTQRTSRPQFQALGLDPAQSVRAASAPALRLISDLMKDGSARKDEFHDVRLNIVSHAGLICEVLSVDGLALSPDFGGQSVVEQVPKLVTGLVGLAPKTAVESMFLAQGKLRDLTPTRLRQPRDNARSLELFGSMCCRKSRV
ncbi:Serine/threonine-protein phosphatase 2A 65 kDa regulatory subunit A beta isoform [Symbiodinium microadriaticum]|uniref:Serine/threonine-protein phosphatase 2A 65 kDa regulatory subunit A beta isoform n=1 Tax=Symbiodinium microadriaticum TaxID=2951 RepID=A0A1Q9C405_SYMMI|nr:Serine/threonine-protein phosphatase 2A 65 kDa regulatory subunit A beta isoform [Symbiodinium microadriaticum]